MTDETAAAPSPPPTHLDLAQSRLDEIRQEQSLPQDATDLIQSLIDEGRAQDQRGQALASWVSDLNAVLRGYEGRVTALETRPAAQVSAAGINLSALEDVKTRIAAARQAGAIAGEVAFMLDGIVAALGAAAPPPSPAPAAEPEQVNTEAVNNAPQATEAAEGETATTEQPDAPEGETGEQGPGQ
jgi:hypothetical protein